MLHQSSYFTSLTALCAVCIDASSQGLKFQASLANIPSHGVLTPADLNAGESSWMSGSPASGTSLLAYQKARRSAEAVWDVADQLYAAAERMNQQDANRRVTRAIASARQNWDQLPGHEFGARPDASADVGLLAKRTKLKLSVCRSGCNGHGSCNSATGQCQCANSWVGAACDVKRCPDDCSGAGMCLAGKCVCDPQRFGENCQHVHCPDDCSGHGYCFSGSCQCSGGYGGDNCFLQVHSSTVVRFKLAKKPLLMSGPPKKSSSLRASDAAFTTKRAHALNQLQTGRTVEFLEEQLCAKGCSGRGSCVQGSCLCFEGYQGRDCSMGAACSGHGMPQASMLATQEGQTTCSCYQGWTGVDCNIELVCPDQSCSSHGNCNYGRCECTSGYSGDSCHVSLIACETRCGSHGTCHADDESKCSCHEGWTGSQCETSPLQAAAPRLSTSPHDSFLQTAKKEDSGDGLDSPMTVSWLQPAKFVQPAADKVAELVKRSSRSTTDLAAGLLQVSTAADAAAGLSQFVLPQATVATVDDAVLWHPAVAPPFAAAGHGEGSSILSLLSSKGEVSGKATGAMRILEDVDQGLGHKSPVPRKLASLLALSPSVSAPVAAGDVSARSSDIESFVGDI